MKRVMFYVSYIVALVMVWCAYRVIAYSSDIIGAIIFLMLAFVVSPVFNNIIYEFSKRDIGVGFKSFFVASLVVGLFSWIDYKHEKGILEEGARAAALHSENLRVRADEVYAESVAKFKEGEYEKVLQITDDYVKSGYEKFSELHTLSSIKVLLSKLEQYPSVKEKVEIYEKLVKLDPENELYVDSLIVAKKDDLVALENARRSIERREKIEVGFSKITGAHVGLELRIKELMKDPSTYSHVKTTYVDKGVYLIVTTHFRGINSFGAVLPQIVRAKVSLDGEVLQLDQM